MYLKNYTLKSNTTLSKTKTIVQPLMTKPIIKIITLFLIAIVLILRGNDRIWHAQFVAEDGVVFFQDAYNLDFLSAVTKSYNGGYYLLARLLSELALLFPLESVPTIFVLSSLIVTIFCCSFFLLDNFNWIVPNLYHRAFFCLLLAALPSTDEVLLRLVNVHWYLGIVDFLLVLMKIPQNFIGKAVYLFLWLFSGLSAPQTIVFTPCLIAKAFGDKRNRTLLVFSAIFLIILAFIIKQQNANVFFVKGVDTSHASLSLAVVNALASRILTSFLSINLTYEWFYNSERLYVAYLLMMPFIVLNAAAIVNCFKRKRWTQLFVWLYSLYCIFAPIIITFLGRPALLLLSQNINKLGILGNERYFILPLVAWYFGFFLWMTSVIGNIRRKYIKHLFALAIVPALIFDFHFENIFIADHQWYSQVQRIKVAEALSPGSTLLVPSNPQEDWSMHLHIPPSYLPRIESLIFVDKPGQGYFDFARANADGQKVVQSDRAVRASGWAINSEANRPANEVLILDKNSNTIVARTIVNQLRTDVAKAMRNRRFRRSGWQVVFPIDRLEIGTHTLRAYAFDSSKMQVFPLAEEMTIEIVDSK